MRRVLVPAVVAVFVGAACLLNRGALAQTWQRVSELSPAGALMIVGCAALVVVMRALTLSIATPGLGLGRAAAADQAHVGATNGVVVGGGAVGTAAKMAMMRSWGVRPLTVGASVIATAVMPAFVTWGLAAIVHLPALLDGNASWPETVATLTGSILVVGAAAFWFLVLVHPMPAALAGRVATRVHRLAERRLPIRWVRVHDLLRGVDPARFTDELRDELHLLVRRRGSVLLLACVAYAAASFVTLWCSLAAMGVSGVGVLEALSVFSMVRVLVSVAPVPGGLGVAEFGLVTLLVDAGADRPGAAGAALIFRAATWLVPMVLGAVGWSFWHRQFRPAGPGEQVGSDPHALEVV